LTAIAANLAVHTRLARSPTQIAVIDAGAICRAPIVIDGVAIIAALALVEYLIATRRDDVILKDLVRRGPLAVQRARVRFRRRSFDLSIRPGFVGRLGWLRFYVGMGLGDRSASTNTE
jgi:hypothetical protein